MSEEEDGYAACTEEKFGSIHKIDTFPTAALRVTKKNGFRAITY